MGETDGSAPASAKPRRKRTASKRRRRSQAPRGRRREQLLAAIGAKPGARPSELAAEIGIAPGQVSTLLAKARAEKLIVKKGAGYTLKKVRYRALGGRIPRDRLLGVSHVLVDLFADVLWQAGRCRPDSRGRRRSASYRLFGLIGSDLDPHVGAHDRRDHPKGRSRDRDDRGLFKSADSRYDHNRERGHCANSDSYRNKATNRSDCFRLIARRAYRSGRLAARPAETPLNESAN
jgi:hypothetical protein